MPRSTPRWLPWAAGALGLLVPAIMMQMARAGGAPAAGRGHPARHRVPDRRSARATMASSHTRRMIALPG
jgi:hypothetical protein